MLLEKGHKLYRLPKIPFGCPFAAGSLGYAYEQQADYAKAVGYFKQLSSAPDTIMRAEALYNLGWLYDKLGQTDQSRQAYDAIISDHPDFIYIDLVKERMSG